MTYLLQIFERALELVHADSGRSFLQRKLAELEHD